MTKFNRRAIKAINYAKKQNSVPSSVDLLNGVVLQNGIATNVLRVLDVDVTEIGRLPQPRGDDFDWPECMATSAKWSKRLGDDQICSEHLLMGLVTQQRAAASTFLAEKNLSPLVICREINNVAGRSYSPDWYVENFA